MKLSGLEDLEGTVCESGRSWSPKVDGSKGGKVGVRSNDCLLFDTNNCSVWLKTVYFHASVYFQDRPLSLVWTWLEILARNWNILRWIDWRCRWIRRIWYFESDVKSITRQFRHQSIFKRLSDSRNISSATSRLLPLLKWLLDIGWCLVTLHHVDSIETGDTASRVSTRDAILPVSIRSPWCSVTRPP